jgi:hypothetical protein
MSSSRGTVKRKADGEKTVSPPPLRRKVQSLTTRMTGSDDFIGDA